jgi:ABC-type glycerol-3-phosphate transport system substrate-binding protein
VPIARLRSTVVVAAVAVALGAGGCGGSAARVQADATTTSAVTSTTLGHALVCAQKIKKFEQDYAALDEYRVALEQTEQTLNAKLDAAVASNSPDAGNLEAQHSAVLRQLSDTQERILQLENSKPDANSCGLSETCAGDSMSSTTVCKSSP